MILVISLLKEVVDVEQAQALLVIVKNAIPEGANVTVSAQVSEQLPIE